MDAITVRGFSLKPRLFGKVHALTTTMDPLEAGTARFVISSGPMRM